MLWHTRFVGLALIALLLAGQNTQARDIFVDNVRGDDVRDGTAPEPSGGRGGPCRTITRALKMARSGDRVILAPSGVPYRESITLQAGNHSGIVNRPFELVGQGATLDGTQPVPPDAWQHVEGTVFRFKPRKTSHQLLYLNGRPAERVESVQSNGERVKLQPLQWYLHDRHVYFCAEKDKLPRSYDLSHTALPVGITIYEARNVLISDLAVQGFQLDGVNAHDGVRNARLVGLTCRGNGRAGISVGGASRVQIVACLVGDNGRAQVRTEGFSHTSLINCDLIGNTAPKLVRDGGQVTVEGDGS